MQRLLVLPKRHFSDQRRTSVSSSFLSIFHVTAQYISALDPRGDAMASPLSTEEFQTAVYMAVQQIPASHITTYGAIAGLIHHPRHARHVGKALRDLPSSAAQPHAEFNSQTVPWWRVVNSGFKISPRGDGDGSLGAQRQAEGLRAEEIRVEQNEMGEYVVRTLGGSGQSVVWSVAVLPSELEDGGIGHEDS